MIKLCSSLNWHSPIKTHCVCFALSNRLDIDGTPLKDAIDNDEMEDLVDNEVYAFTSLLCENESHKERCKNCDDIVRYSV